MESMDRTFMECYIYSCLEHLSHHGQNSDITEPILILHQTTDVGLSSVNLVNQRGVRLCRILVVNYRV